MNCILNTYFFNSQAGVYVKNSLTLLAYLFFITNNSLVSQTNGANIFSLQECLETATKNHESVKIASLELEYNREMKKTALDLPKTSFMYTQGQFNSIYKYDNNVTISQTFPFPSVVSSHAALGKAQVKGSEINVKLVKAELELQLKEVFYNLQLSLQEIDLLHAEDSIYEVFLRIESTKGDRPGHSGLEKTSVEEHSYLLKSMLDEQRQLITDNRIVLQTMMRTNDLPFVVRLKGADQILTIDTTGKNINEHPLILRLKQEIEISEKARRFEVQKGFPDIVLGYFNQTIYGPANIFGEDYFLTTANRLQGFQLGLIVPIFFSAHHARVNAASIHEKIAQEKFNQERVLVSGHYKQVINKYLMSKKNLDFYNEFLLKNAGKMINEALEAFNKSEISYFEYLQTLSKSLEIQRNYVRLIHQNNTAVIQLEYLLSK